MKYYLAQAHPLSFLLLEFGILGRRFAEFGLESLDGGVVGGESSAPLRLLLECVDSGLELRVLFLESSLGGYELLALGGLGGHVVECDQVHLVLLVKPLDRSSGLLLERLLLRLEAGV